MKEYIISCCSTADLTEEHFKDRDIECVFFHYELDGKEYLDDLGKSMSLDDFYQAMVDWSRNQNISGKCRRIRGTF